MNSLARTYWLPFRQLRCATVTGHGLNSVFYVSNKTVPTSATFIW